MASPQLGGVVGVGARHGAPRCWEVPDLSALMPPSSAPAESRQRGVTEMQ